jgi:uncharacterized membrane protein
MPLKSVSKKIRSICGHNSLLRGYSWYAKVIASKNSLFFVMSVCVIALVLSCKHYIPGMPETLGGGGGGGSNPNDPPVTSTCSADTAYFQQQVLPIFVSNCAMSGCHDNASHKEGITTTSYSSIMAGGIRAGNPGSSKLYSVIVNGSMPPRPYSKLTQDQINIINKWITQGAKNNSCVSATCDTANVKFSTSVKSIISNKCQGCHSASSPGGGYDLSTYTGMKAVVNNGRLWGSINFTAGFSGMPKGGTKLSSCELATIKKWIDAGAPNN